jgi:hypothetical protein
VGNNCVNNNSILVKKVYKDLNYTPLCLACCKRHRRAIVKFKKISINLTDIEIIETYFDTLNLTDIEIIETYFDTLNLS